MLETIITFPVIQTQRLVLRQIHKEDVNSLYEIFSDEDIVKCFGYRIDKEISEAYALIARWEGFLFKRIGIRWGLGLKENPEIMIGNGGFRRISDDGYTAELGYVLHKDYWRLGLMHEALEAIIPFGFNDMKLHTIEASVFPENSASCKLLEKLGFTCKQLQKANYLFDGKLHDTYKFVLQKKEN